MIFRLTIGILYLIANSSLALATESLTLQDLAKIIAIQETKIKQLEDQPKFGVGSVQYSFLNEKEFIELHGDGWVRCDGREVQDSKYAQVTGKDRIPDCTGRFLRVNHSNQGENVGSLAPLGQKNGQSTAVNNLTVANYNGTKNFTGKATGDIGSEGSAHSHLIRFPDSYWHPGTRKHAAPYSVGGWVTGGQQPLAGPTLPTHSDGAHSHLNVSLTAKTSGDINHGHSLQGDKETAPYSVTVNAYVRID